MGTGMIDQGMYDAAEVARLVGHSVEWVVGLSTDSTQGPAPVPRLLSGCSPSSTSSVSISLRSFVAGGV